MRAIRWIAFGLVLTATGCGGGGGGSNPTPPPVTIAGPRISLLPGTVHVATNRVNLALDVVSSRPVTVTWTVVHGSETAALFGTPAADGDTTVSFAVNGTWRVLATVADDQGRTDFREYSLVVNAPAAAPLAGTILEGEGVAAPRAGLPVELRWQLGTGDVTVARVDTDAAGRWSFSDLILPLEEVSIFIAP